MSGTLYVIATPIGNLKDITLRAIETLKTVDVVACEDTRMTGKLLHHLGIKKPLQRYDDHTHPQASRKILNNLSAGQTVALVTDAGTPAISDPGSRLVDSALDSGVPVVPIPGPSSPITALSASGFNASEFVFLGFLPRRDGRAKRQLQEALGLGKTIVFMESPFRVNKSLEMIKELNPKARVALARELTKIHEEIKRGTVSQVQAQVQQKTIKGEALILIEPLEK